MISCANNNVVRPCARGYDGDHIVLPSGTVTDDLVGVSKIEYVRLFETLPCNIYRIELFAYFSKLLKNYQPVKPR